jgi:hypothetical protein
MQFRPSLSLATVAGTLLAALAAAPAHAGDVYWSVGVQAAPGVTVQVGSAPRVVAQQPPVIVQHPPVVVHRPVVVAQPPVVVVQPAPVVYVKPGHRHWDRRDHRHHHHGQPQVVYVVPRGHAVAPVNYSQGPDYGHRY